MVAAGAQGEEMGAYTGVATMEVERSRWIQQHFEVRVGVNC